MKQILIVDDSAFLRRILKEHLSKHRPSGPLADGSVLLEAATKADALRQFHAEHPDVVLLDIVMDGGERDGIEILSEIMRARKPPKVIMMSAIGQDRVIQECMTLGATGYVIKPFDEQQVVSAVEGALADRPRVVMAAQSPNRGG